MFQFLGRNSGRSDFGPATRHEHLVNVSIPRSEFWSFGLGVRRPAGLFYNPVSIPRSEFWSFGRSGG